MKKQVRVVMTAHGRGEVFVDGQKIKGVKSLSFSAAVDSPNLLNLTIGAEQVEIDGVACVDLSNIGDTERRIEKAA